MGRLRRRFRPPVERVGDDAFDVNLNAEERTFLSGLTEQLQELVATAAPDDPRLRRLFPVAYHDDPERDAEYQRLMRDDLVRSRLASAEALREVLTGTPAEGDDGPLRLDQAQTMAFMQSLNGLRLILGTLLDVSEEDDPTLVADDDPDAPEHHLYAWLSWLLEWTVQALSAG